MSLYSCVRCDRSEHDRCDGTVTIMDQDGSNRYECECHCQYAIREKRRSDERVAGALARFRRDLSASERVAVAVSVLGADTPATKEER